MITCRVAVELQSIVDLILDRISRVSLLFGGRLRNADVSSH